MYTKRTVYLDSRVRRFGPFFETVKSGTDAGCKIEFSYTFTVQEMLFILKAVLCAFGFKVGKIYANMIFKQITKINMDNKSAEFEAYFKSVEKMAKKVS